MQNLTVKLDSCSYQINFIDGSEETIFSELSPYTNKKICLISDRHVYKLYGKNLNEVLSKKGLNIFHYEFRPGEKHKNIKSIMGLINFALARKWNRDDMFLVMGGGVTGDMGAFAASIILRGINYLQIPTTLLAQVDSSVGGKTGVDHKAGKNLIGSFYQPSKVLISTSFLKTLPLREIKTGMAEVVKTGVIANKKLFHDLETFFSERKLESYREFPDPFWTELVFESLLIKSQVVTLDEKESGLRMILNYGHTFGHALEKLTGYSVYTHGEAVAIGMNIAANIACKLKICKQDVVERQTNLLKRLQLPLLPQKKISPDRLLECMMLDKKVKSNRLTLILPEEIGKVRIVKDLKIEDLRELLKELK
ncbi:MAG: 3-dehydroquinate synthase [Candidatus Margulisbacteria bacterium]|nr:3-dehydroquinate synthase [Candidatus Margulisiibacteriota bacterium]